MSFHTSPHPHEAQGHDGKEYVAVASSQTQSLDRALRPASASSVVAAATARQHSLGRNQPHHLPHPPPLTGLASQNGAQTKEAKYAHAHAQLAALLCDSCLTSDPLLASVTIRSLQLPHPLLPSCRQQDKCRSPTAPLTQLPWQPRCSLLLLVTKVTATLHCVPCVCVHYHP